MDYLQKYRFTLFFSLMFGYFMYIIMFVILGTNYKIYDSNFFKLIINETNTENNPQVLGIPLRTWGEYWGLAIFFFLNAALGVWNGVVIDSLFGLMVFDEDEEIISRIEHTFERPGIMTVFALYDVWRTVRYFFSILGVFSNIGFFIATATGTLVAGLGTKRIYLDPSGVHWIKLTLQKEIKKKKREKKQGTGVRDEEMADLLSVSSLTGLRCVMQSSKNI